MTVPPSVASVHVLPVRSADRDRASGVDRGAGGDRGPGEAARIGERLDDAGAQVEQRAGVDVDADALCGLRLRENPDRRAALAPLFRALLDLCEPGTPDRALQRAIADKLAVDAVFVDQRVDGRRAAAQEAEQPFAIIRAEPRDDVVGREPHPSVDQADIAPRAAEADLDRLERHDPRSGLSQMQGGRKAGIAATDHGNIGPGVALERRGRRRRRSGHFPQTMRERIVLHARYRILEPGQRMAMIGFRRRSFHLGLALDASSAGQYRSILAQLLVRKSNRSRRLADAGAGGPRTLR